jgi:hypothetical protein
LDFTHSIPVIIDTCDVSSILPSNNNIFSSNVLSCSVLQGRLTLFSDDTLMADSAGIEALLNLSRSLIKGGMNSGELALVNDAIVVLRYREESDKVLAPIVAVIAPARDKRNFSAQWAIIGLAILAALLALLAARKRWQKKKDKERKTGILDDHSNVSYTYDFSDFIESPRSMDLKMQSREHHTRSISYIDLHHHEKKLSPLDLESLDGFIINRFSPHDDFASTDDDRLHLENMSNGNCNDVTASHRNDLSHVYIGTVKNRSLTLDDERDYTYEAMGKNRGTTPKCSICFKTADGWMKRCQCRNSSCDKIAHASCIYGKNPTPSISYPGTPPPVLPAILCGSENRGLQRSRSYDEESSVGSGISKSLSFDGSVKAHKQMRDGIMGCLECR